MRGEVKTAEALLGSMTWDEKLAQMQVVFRPDPAELGRWVRAGVGATFWPRSAATANALQRVAVEETRLAAAEAASGGVNWTFSPMIDVSRDPRWGGWPRASERIRAGETVTVSFELGREQLGFWDTEAAPARFAVEPGTFVLYLGGSLRAACELTYRIIYRIDEAKHQVEIYSIRHRRDAYRT